MDSAFSRCHSRYVPIVDLLLGRPSPTSQTDASKTSGEGVTIYWRDGCPFCLRLRWTVRKYAGQATWVDIWADPDAASFVRSTNEEGNEVVPTVVIDGVPHTNPVPRLVLSRLAGRS